MPSYGSSRIKTLIITATGGVGPTGATGATGNTGAYVTGPEGPVGIGILTIRYNPTTDGITFNLTNGSSIGFTGIRGNTGVGPAPYPQIGYTSSGISPITNSVGQAEGYTLYFRSISVSSGLSASISGDLVIIENNPASTGSFDIGELLYVAYSSTSQQYYLNTADSTDYKEIYSGGVTYSSFSATLKTARDIFDGANFNYSTGGTQGISHSGLTLEIDAAFYGVTGTENGLTSGAWYPYLRFRSSYSDVNGTSGVTSGNIYFSQLGPYTKKISYSEPIGSCCYCDGCEDDPHGGRKCLDYVSKSYCDLIVGRWSISSCQNRLNTYDCYLRRACCVNGTCINTSQAKCVQMHGEFYPNNECGASFDCERGFFGTLALTDTESGSEPVCCCKDGLLVSNNQTAEECVAGGGTPVGNPPCADNLCCGVSTSFGACCKGNGICEELTPEQCASEGGVYRGTGISCSPNPCCTPPTT